VKLPQGEDAIIPVGKIELYCLNPFHGRGGDKARVFAAALGITPGHAGVLKAALRRAAVESEAALVASGSAITTASISGCGTPAKTG
jgi:hypothetical protein